MGVVRHAWGVGLVVPAPGTMTDPLQNSSEAKLSDPRYRAAMLGKIEALISVLEVAHSKVLASLGTPSADRARLTRVEAQVANTLKVCRKARVALRGEAPISREEILETDLEALCSRLAQVEPI